MIIEFKQIASTLCLGVDKDVWGRSVLEFQNSQSEVDSSQMRPAEWNPWQGAPSPQKHVS